MTTTAYTRTDFHSAMGQDFYPDFDGVPTVDELLNNLEPLESSTVFAHYFAPGFDFWLQAVDIETGIAFGLVRGVEPEFGSVDLKELCTATFAGYFRVVREVDTTSPFRAFMKPKPLSEFETNTTSPCNGVAHWFG